MAQSHGHKGHPRTALLAGSPMTKAQIAAAIQAIVRLQLDDCRRAIKDGTKTIALNELEDAMRQLKLLAKRLEA